MLTLDEFVARHERGSWIKGHRGGWWMPLNPTRWRVVAWQAEGHWHAKLVHSVTREERRCSRPRGRLDQFNGPAAALAYRLTWPNVVPLRRPA